MPHNRYSKYSKSNTCNDRVDASKKDWAFARDGLASWRKMRTHVPAAASPMAHTLKTFLDLEKIDVTELIPDELEREHFLKDVQLFQSQLRNDP